MLDAIGYKSTADDAKEFDALAREIFREETLGQEPNLDTLVGHDQNGNLWIYASEEAKQYAESRSQSQCNTPLAPSSPATKPTDPLAVRHPSIKTLTQISSEEEGRISRAESEPAVPTTDKSKSEGEGYAYAKTLRLTSEQLVCLLNPSLTRNR